MEEEQRSTSNHNPSVAEVPTETTEQQLGTELVSNVPFSLRTECFSITQCISLYLNNICILYSICIYVYIEALTLPAFTCDPGYMYMYMYVYVHLCLSSSVLLHQPTKVVCMHTSNHLYVHMMICNKTVISLFSMLKQRNEGTGGEEEKNYQRQLLMECIKEEKYIESSRPRFRERRLSQGAEFDREGEVNFINRDRRSKEILISVNEYRKSREMTMRDYRKSREYPSDYKKEKDDLYREEKEKVEKKDREKESVYDSISGKVKDWATRRRQGMGNKKRGSAEVVYVASNPLHHFLKVNANQREKEERERELAELHKST